MNKKYSKPSAIIFDFDDTLVDAKNVLNQSIKKTFAHFNINQDLLKSTNTNRSLRDYFYEIFADNINEARDVYYKHYEDLSHNIIPLEKAESVLAYLKQHSVYTAIVSNKTGARLREEVKNKFNWDHFFQAVIGAGDAKQDKPSALPAIMALEKSGLTNHQEVWLIGDSIIDIQTANNLGCKAILFGNSASIPQNLKVYLQIQNHTELLKLLMDIYNVY